MSGRWGWFIIFICSIVPAIIFAFAFSEDISAELHISDLIKNGVYTEGVLVQELKGSSNNKFFKGEYEAKSLKCDFIINDDENRLSLYDTVTIIYDSKNPHDYIIESYYSNSGLPYVSTGLICLLFLIFLALWSLYDFIKIGYLEDNGKRVLCEPIKFKWNWWARGAVYTVVCKIPGEDSKIYKGVCRIRFKELMEENNNLKYIPIYISRNRKNLYYVNCEEVSKIVKHGRYNGHTIEDLQ